jgi:hypothetical protein
MVEGARFAAARPGKAQKPKAQTFGFKLESG